MFLLDLGFLIGLIVLCQAENKRFIFFGSSAPSLGKYLFKSVSKVAQFHFVGRLNECSPICRSVHQLLYCVRPRLCLVDEASQKNEKLTVVVKKRKHVSFKFVLTSPSQKSIEQWEIVKLR